MRHYQAKILKNGQLAVFTFDASSDDEARSRATEGGATLVSLKAAGGSLRWPTLQRHGFDLVLFSQELTGLLDAGLSVIEALEGLSEKSTGGVYQRVIKVLVAALYEGKSLSQAMALQPDAFPEIYIAGIQASEQTSGLVTALSRYVSYRQQAEVLRKRLIGASIYPAIVFVVGVGVSLFLLIYLVPKFSQVYEGMPNKLPTLSQWLLTWGGFASQHLGWVLGTLTLLIVGTIGALASQRVRAKLLNLLLTIPAFNRAWYLVQLTRLYRSLGMLLVGGIPLVKALNLCTQLLPPSLQPRLSQAEQGVREGLSLSTVFDKQHLSTPVATRMLRVGERSGQLGDMLLRIAQLNDEDIERLTDKIMRIFPPLLLLAIAMFVGTIVVLMYLPIFDLAGSL
ncbi:type II secretion system F family protein [Chitinivorax sp. B]|uniref:type II secretion system F family protein n=1 Tax=Chitinivorax sp. B TaxID=2502235 RepID=UPI0010F66316|nr:type II secretion system F family protein [Chitinivorax sp. B]